jgi:hypothetical protein
MIIIIIGYGGFVLPVFVKYIIHLYTLRAISGQYYFSLNFISSAVLITLLKTRVSNNIFLIFEPDK